MCLGFGINGSFCGVTCETESDCPSGFTCINVGDSAGNTVGSQCITYCWLYEDEATRAPSGAPDIDIEDYGVCPVEDQR